MRRTERNLPPAIPTLAIALALAAAGSAPRAAAQEKPAQAPAETAPLQTVAPKARAFNISMRHSFNPIPKDLQELHVWFPMPPDTEHQQVHNRQIETAYVVESAVDESTGNQFMHMRGGPRGGLPMTASARFDAQRIEILRRDISPPARKPTPEEDKAIADRWLAPDTMTIIDRSLRSQASKITSGRRQPLERARAIYDFVVKELALIENPLELQGAGYGNVAFTLKNLKGDATDLASAFVGLCRAAGIPARPIIGFQIPVGIRTGKLGRYHAWAEFYLAGIGWIPADPTEGHRNPSRRDYYFGSLDENRLEFSTGRDIEMIPPQKGRPLNFFINAYWEGNGREMPTPWVDVEFTELDQIQPGTLQMVPTDAATPPPN
ncbi:MAG TPA: transglutaminase-like domain-containing protein [Candidatus Polarisedimenticolia bacterium]|nr:transglutaminase-like domain-containing protein [Candidatus Polarisedimenticolia bacterium]